MNRFLYDNGFRHERFKAEFYIDKLSRYLDRLITPINVWKLKTISARLTPSCIILQNGQIYLEKSCGVNHGIFLKYVWAFLNIMHERINVLNFRLNALTLSWRRSLSCRNQSIDLQSKSMDWFPYDRDLRQERVKMYFMSSEKENGTNLTALIITQEFEKKTCLVHLVLSS